MKFIAVFCAVSVFVALTYGETCRDETQCDHVSCDSMYVLECVRGECTCTHHSTCLDRADCGAGSGNATVDDDDLVCRAGWHCIDQVCRCGFGFQRPDNFNGRP